MRKFLLSMFTAIMAIGFVGCEYDDSDLWNEVNSLKDRVLTLEQLCQQMNTNISSLQSLVSALQNQDYITSVTPIKQGNDVIGYTITFAKGEPITIYHGQDGKNGADGEDGKDGYTPVIGVDKDEDGVYYWTLDGEWLTDADGNKIPTSGKDGADGEDGEGGNGSMPELKIQGGYWYVSYDGGENWERLGRATGYDGTDGKDGQNGQDGDSFFKSVTFDDNYVIFVLNDKNGTTIVVPRQKGQESLIALEAVAKNGGKITLTDDVELDELLAITTGKTVTIDLNGHNITGNTISIKSNGNVVIEGEGTISSDDGYGIENAGNLTIDGATINAIKNTGELDFVSGAINNEDPGISGIQSNAGLVTLGEDVEINSARHALRIEGGEVIIEGGEYRTIPTAGKTQHALNVGGAGVATKVTINGGIFVGPQGTLSDSGAAVNVQADGEVTINGGDFSKGKNNTLASKGTLTVKGGTFDQDPSVYAADGLKGLKNSSGVWVIVEDDVDAVASSSEELANAITNNATTIKLAAGTYIIPAAAKGKTLTIVGTGNPEDVKIAVTKVGTGGENCDYGFDGSTATLENVTITTNSSTYIGYARFNGTYKNCIINGTYTLYGDSVFEDCTFNVSGDVYNIWTWGAPTATFTRCTFNSDGKAMLLYGERDTKLTMYSCTFNDKGGLTAKKAAIEIGSHNQCKRELIVNNATVNGYEINDEGINTNTTLWGNKNSMSKDLLNVVVDGVDVY